MKAAVVLGVYAAVLVLGGFIAYTSAPADANAMTALIIPGACAVVIVGCALLVVVGFKGNRKLAMVGAHLAMVFTLVFAVAFGMRAKAGFDASREYREGVEQFEAAGISGAPLGEAAQKAYLEGRDLPTHDKAYLAYTLSGLVVASVLAFGALVAVRPKPGARGGDTSA